MIDAFGCRGGGGNAQPSNPKDLAISTGQRDERSRTPRIGWGYKFDSSMTKGDIRAMPPATATLLT